MLTQEQRQQLVSHVRQMQIFVSAMAMGVFMFGIVTLFITTGQAAGEPGILTLLGIVLGLVGGVMGVVIPRLLVDRVMSPTSANYLTRVIVACAFFEGVAFFNLVAFMLEQQFYSLFMAALLLACILLQFPTVEGVGEWIGARERARREMRGFDR